MGELDILKTLADAGGYAVLAGIVLYWKRSDDREVKAERVQEAERTRAREKSVLEALIANTEALRALTASVERQHDTDRLIERLRREVRGE